MSLDPNTAYNNDDFKTHFSVPIAKVLKNQALSGPEQIKAINSIVKDATEALKSDSDLCTKFKLFEHYAAHVLEQDHISNRLELYKTFAQFRANPTAFQPNETENLKEIDSNTAKNMAIKIDNKAPRIIFLTGTSSAGKSSIMNAYAERNENIQVMGIDDYSTALGAEIIKIHFPQEYVILSKALDDDHLMQFVDLPVSQIEKFPAIFKKNSTEEERAAAMQLKKSEKFADNPSNENTVGYMIFNQYLKHDLQNRSHFNAIIAAYNAGKTVIFDTPNAKGFLEHVQNHPKIPVQRFLVYVPITDLVERLPKRNAKAEETGNLIDRRGYVQLLKGFMDVYRPAKSGDTTLDVLKMEDILNLFEKRAMEIADDNEGYEADGMKGLTLKEFLTHFGLDANNEVAITVNSDNPEIHNRGEFQKFEGIFRTALPTQTPNVSAEQLASHTWEKF